MALDSLGTLYFALSQMMMPDLYRQWNRTVPVLALLNAAGDIGSGDGRNVAFDTEFTGASATTVAEGADVQASEFATDINVPATFSWAHYRSSFQITETEIDAALSSREVPAAIQRIFGSRVLSAGASIARLVDNHVLNGTGVDGSGNATVTGFFGGALVASGAYGNINPATYPEWAATVISNGGVARTLTVDLMDQMDAGIFTASSIPYTDIVTSPGVIRKYMSMGYFGNAVTSGTGTTNNQRFNDVPPGGRAVAIGAPNDEVMQPAAYYKGTRIWRDPTAPTGQLAFINTRHVKVKFLPRTPDPNDAVIMQMLGLQGASDYDRPGGIVQATGIPARLATLAKTGDSIKVSVKVTLQMCVTRPNCMGIIKDISET
jgi:hypothetical protein